MIIIIYVNACKGQPYSSIVVVKMHFIQTDYLKKAILETIMESLNKHLQYEKMVY